jgi:NitT/TauT family transport system permease protein
MAVPSPHPPIRVSLSQRERLSGPASTVGWWAISIGIVVLAWEMIWVLGWINPVIWPPPHMTLMEVRNQPDFLRPAVGVHRVGAHFVALTAVTATLQRVAVGITMAALAGLAFGCLAYSLGLVRNLFLPTITILASVAPIGWLPFALVLFGIGDVAATMVVFLGLVFVLTVAVVHSLDTVERRYVNTARMLGASRWQTARHVLLPASLPPLFVILRVNFLSAWIVVMAAEVLGVNTGLGAIIQVGRQMLNMKLMFLGMIMVGVTGFLIDQAFSLVQQRVLWWKGSGYV